MFPFRLTAGTLIKSYYPHDDPNGWKLRMGGSDCRDATGKPWTLGLCWCTLQDPKGRIWIEWFNSYFGVRVALPRGTSVIFDIDRRR